MACPYSRAGAGGHDQHQALLPFGDFVEGSVDGDFLVIVRLFVGAVRVVRLGQDGFLGGGLNAFPSLSAYFFSSRSMATWSSTRLISRMRLYLSISSHDQILSIEMHKALTIKVMDQPTISLSSLAW